MELPGNEWACWSWICLRGSGFPLHLPRQLAAPAMAAAADRLFLSETAVEEGFRVAIAAFRTQADQAGDDAQKKSVRHALRLLQKKRIPERTGTSADSAVAELSKLVSRLEEDRSRFIKEFQSGTAAVSAKIREIASDSRFRQAVLLQNRGALRRVTHAFAAAGAQSKRGFKERQNEELIAGYLQRYCLKNDTIGFFGPVGWAQLVDHEPHLAVHPGPGLISKSSIYFENWGIETLAEKMAGTASLRAWIAPRLLPLFRVEGSVLYTPGGSASVVPPLHALVLQKCRGEQTAVEIAREVMAVPDGGVRSRDQVFEILQVYAARRVISWTFEIPRCLHPEKHLRYLLEQVEDEELRRPPLNELEELDRARNEVSRAIGNADLLDKSLDELDATFTRLTGRPPTKSAGAMYAARTLIYQDCQRDLTVEVGAKTLAAMGVPLSLLLTGARWFTYKVAGLYRQAIGGMVDDLTRSNGGGPVELTKLWARIETLIYHPERKLFNEVAPEFRSRWERILRIPSEGRRVGHAGAELKPMVEELFAAPHAGWQLGRYHSPDVMIAASDVEAVRRGDCTFCLGELHMATNTVRASFAASQHPDPKQLYDAVQSDLPRPRAVFVPPRNWPGITNRTAMIVVSPEDHHIEVSAAPISGVPRSQTFPISAFVVERSGEEVIVRNRNGGESFEIVEFLGDLLSGAAIEMMKITEPRAHMPRITIDQLVIVRESWSFAVTEMRFINEESESERYLEARRWMTENNLPRFVFVRVPVEVKPCYLDFESPIYVEIFIKMIRRLLASPRAKEAVTISEMLPLPEQHWLPDASGQIYTSEFRIVAWDLRSDEK